MRNFDNYEQITDNEGNLLVGKLVFCRKGTTTQETIYAWDSEHNEYVAINPEVYINANGRPENQIFLGDTDYTIYVFKYIGNGEMDLDADPENWLAQYSFNNLYLTFEIDIKTDSPTLIANMTELEATDPANVGLVNGKALVCLGGYNALGDCPPVFYVWDNTSTKTATGVDIVAVTGISVGRWLLVNTFTEIGFDVRHAGCFAEPTTADTNINQSYAIQRADTYAVKYGLKLVFPDLFDDTYSYYLLTNLIVNSEVVAADGVKLITATSANLKNVSEENLKKKVPFVYHDGTYTGTWSVTGDTIRTGYFENQETGSNTNWPPTIVANKKYIYDASFNCDGGIDPIIAVSNIDVEFVLLLENEIYRLTNCKIESKGKIKRHCYFYDCEIKGTFFDSTLTARDMADNSFSGCKSSIDTWGSVEKFVVYKAYNGDRWLDLDGRNCSLDLSSYGGGNYYPFPFLKITNATFSSITTFPVDKDGVKGTFLTLENVSMAALELSPNTAITSFILKNCNININQENSGTLPNAVFKAQGSTISGDALQVKTFEIYNCNIQNAIGNNSGSATATGIVEDSIIDGHCIDFFSTSTFNVIFKNNVLRNGGQLGFYGSGANQTFVKTIIANNSVEDGPRDFIVNGVSSWNLANIGSYEYNGNTGILKGEDKIKLVLRIPYYTYGATIPDGTLRYFQQRSANSDYCDLKGVTIGDVLFSFGENTQHDILARTEPPCNTYGAGPNYLREFSDSGTFVNSDTYQKVAGAICTAIYDAGVVDTKGIFDGTFGGYDCVVITHSGLSDGDLCDLVLQIDKVHRAEATGGLVK